MPAEQIARVDGACFQHHLEPIAQQGGTICHHLSQSGGLQQGNGNDPWDQPPGRRSGRGSDARHDPVFRFGSSRVATQAPPSRITPAPR